MSSNNIYNILGKLNALTPKEEPVAQTKQIYESVEAKGSVLEGVKSVQQTLSEKYAGFKEERETLKTKGGTIYKGGTYGTDFDAGDEDGEKKKKPKAKDGEKKGRGRPKKEKPAEYSGPKGDLFGRTTGTAPKGKKGTVVKGKANQDTVDESELNEFGPIENDGYDEVGREKFAKFKGAKTPNNPQGVRRAKTKYTPTPKPQVKRLEKPMDEDAVDDFMAKGGQVQVGKYHKPRKSEQPGFGSKHIGGAGDKQKASRTGVSAKTQGNKVVGMAEGKVSTGKALMENINFRKMVDEANMTVDEMLEAINGDIQAYKASGDMSNRLRDFMHLHNHMKKVEEEAASSLAPQHALDLNPDLKAQAQGNATAKKSMFQKGMDLISHPSDDEMLAQLQQDSQPTIDEELDELARMAGIHEAKLADFAKLAGIFQEGKDYGDTTYNEPPTYDNSPDECVQGEDVMLKGGDGEVAGKEKAMKSDKPTFKNGDNPLAEDTALLKPADKFNYVKEMGRDLMKAYQGIKTK